MLMMVVKEVVGEGTRWFAGRLGKWLVEPFGKRLRWRWRRLFRLFEQPPWFVPRQIRLMGAVVVGFETIHAPKAIGASSGAIRGPQPGDCRTQAHLGEVASGAP